jgi:diguanylate cyclase (GGDEF)-like protein/PAS domain S-box-containing protein
MTIATNLSELDIDSKPDEISSQNKNEEKTLSTLINKNQDLHYLYRQAPIGIVLSIISALLICWFVMPQVPDYLYIPWLAFVVIANFTHTLLVKEFNKSRQTLHVNNQWANYHTFMTGITALTFSIGYLMFLPMVSDFIQTVLLLIMATLAVSFLPVLSIFLPAYILYISAFIFPTVYWIYSLPPASGYPLAGLLTVTYCMLIIVASYYSRALLDAFSLAEQVNQQANKLREMLEQRNTDNIKLKKDIYELGKYSDSALRQKEQAEITLQSIGEGVITTDQFGKVTYINPVAEVYTGYQSREIASRKISTVLKLVDESSHIELPNPVFSCLEKKIPIHGIEATSLIRRDGLEYGIDYNVTPIMSEKGMLQGAVMVFRDITEKRKLEKNLNWQDKHDALTGLINRPEFNHRLEHLLKNHDSKEHEHALCLIDLDRFRAINESCGNASGDELLQKIASRLRNLVRDTDTLAHLSNDEFAVLMYSCSVEKSKLIAEIFREEIHKTSFRCQEKSFQISASIGIAMISPDEIDDVSQVYRNVEIACNKAKSSGGNNTQIFSKDMTGHRQLTGQLKILEELQQNLDQESFSVFTQRIKPLDEVNELIMYECLLRMSDKDKNIIPAENFIRTAETYHLLNSIDKWMLKRVLEMIAYKHPLFQEANLVSLNISKQSILNEHYVGLISDLLKEYEVPASKLCFEINERHFYGKINSLQRFVSLIKQLGGKVALDDFNYNPETINSVRTLDLDFVKLDARQFGDIKEESGFNYALLETINNINHMVGAQTIVKRVDNKEMIEPLYEIGTDYIQGYVFEAPQPVRHN